MGDSRLPTEVELVYEGMPCNALRTAPPPSNVPRGTRTSEQRQTYERLKQTFRTYTKGNRLRYNREGTHQISLLAARDTLHAEILTRVSPLQLPYRRPST